VNEGVTGVLKRREAAPTGYPAPRSTRGSCASPSRRSLPRRGYEERPAAASGAIQRRRSRARSRTRAFQRGVRASRVRRHAQPVVMTTSPSSGRRRGLSSGARSGVASSPCGAWSAAADLRCASALRNTPAALHAAVLGQCREPPACTSRCKGTPAPTTRRGPWCVDVLPRNVRLPPTARLTPPPPAPPQRIQRAFGRWRDPRHEADRGVHRACDVAPHLRKHVRPPPPLPQLFIVQNAAGETDHPRGQQIVQLASACSSRASRPNQRSLCL